ncbi:UNVERIFIED_CONTAM: Receptor-like serine/threonine-protein kinase SD1-7 [Sesamum angustifolium]|uniref:Receptor-like serine/threonine-protein kinase SD1-7 n=1 Tax=Sesamum angustifolium TaxID=2727405 RepID=A0AAW2KVL8_9LAMI
MRHSKQNIYIRVSASEVSEAEISTDLEKEKEKKRPIKLMLISMVSGVLVSGFINGAILLMTRRKMRALKNEDLNYLYSSGQQLWPQQMTSLREKLEKEFWPCLQGQLVSGRRNSREKIVKNFWTSGYMAPEYAMDGKFSVKSDIFSMGVVLLEIVSGQKNRGFDHCPHCHSLLEHAWLLWKENNILELMDECLNDTFVESEVKRCVQVGLLCVQKCAEDRPVMSSVLFMLGTEGAILPEPKEPGFFMEGVPALQEVVHQIVLSMRNTQCLSLTWRPDERGSTYYKIFIC